MTAHSSKAVEVLADWLLEIDQEQADEDAQELLDFLTAADLSIVREGQARIEGKVMRLEQTGYRCRECNARAGMHVGTSWHSYQCSMPGFQPLYVAIPTDEGDEG